MSKSAKKPHPSKPRCRERQSLRKARAADRPASQEKSKTDARSKQSRVIAMLQSPTGTTIAAMMKATGWQQHSVRGFLAGVVRKKLKLKLNSKKIDGTRIYRIDARQCKAKQPAIKTSAAQPDRHAACEDRSGAAGSKTLDVEIARLRDLDLGGLQARWHNVFRRRPPPHLPRHLLFRVLAYRLQADRFGDLDAESQAAARWCGIAGRCRQARGGPQPTDR